MPTKKKTTEEFINEANKIHNNLYIYTKVKYINAKTKVTITCKEHGDFKLVASMHVNNTPRGCPKCGIQKRFINTKKTSEQFILDISFVHNEYDFSNVNYINNSTKVKVICKKHGEFLITPMSLLQGCGCTKCKYDNLSKKYIKNTNCFLKECIEIHKNRYNYEKVNYKGAFSNIEIICNIHGSFVQLARTHLQGHGCPKCRNYTNENECINIIENLTNEAFIHKKHNFIKNNKGYLLELDGFNSNLNLAIEYNGKQHYEFHAYFHKNGYIDLVKQKENDKIKQEKCYENGIYLIIIPYWVKNKRQYIEDEYKNYEFLRSFNC